MVNFVSLKELASQVTDGSSVTMGGSLLHRGPFAFCRELIRQGTKSLTFIKPSPGYDLDILSAGKVVSKAQVGIVLMENGYGLAPNYRRAVEKGDVVLEEHACATILAGMRAASSGIPFQPIAGLDGSDIPKENGWKKLKSPYGEEEVYVVPAIRPDFAIIHASEVDEKGNVRVNGTPYWDRIMSRSAKKVLITAEKVVPHEEFLKIPERTLIPGFMVESIAIIPQGAWPGTSFGDYDVDHEAVREYLELSKGDKSILSTHLENAPEMKYREVTVNG